MTAVAALGVYRAYRHTLHDRVMNYLGLYQVEVEEPGRVVDDQPEQFDSESTRSTQQESQLTASDQEFGVREQKLAHQPSG